MKPIARRGDFVTIYLFECDCAYRIQLQLPLCWVLCAHCSYRRIETMIEYLKTWLELKTDRRAVTALEYGVIAGVLAVVVVTAFTTLGTGLNTAFTNVSKQL